MHSLKKVYCFTLTLKSHLDQDTDHLTYTIDKVIIEIILWDPEDVEGQTYENAMCMFTMYIYTVNHLTIK